MNSENSVAGNEGYVVDLASRISISLESVGRFNGGNGTETAAIEERAEDHKERSGKYII